ncbi:MAG: hypothetical protein LQ340_005224 [Diploschistes diacapsis]|nr:MAG: hypothetical protein LQ340_005224 [Diploschistes diacapsis]
MLDASRKREGPLPATLLSLVALAASSHSGINNVVRGEYLATPAREILGYISNDRNSILALRRVSQAFKQWVSPLDRSIFCRVAFVYPALVRHKRHSRVKTDNPGLQYGQILVSIKPAACYIMPFFALQISSSKRSCHQEKSSLDALFRIQPLITHLHLKIAPTAPSIHDPGTQLLDSLLRSDGLQQLSIHLLPDDKCLPSTIDSIAPKAVSNHLWTLPYFAPQDGPSPPPLSELHPEMTAGADPCKTETVSHALPLLLLRETLERCRPHMKLLRSVHFENLSIQGVHALSALEITQNDGETESGSSFWSLIPALRLSIIKWWAIPAEHWPFFDEKSGVATFPVSTDPTARRSKEVNLKLRGWQVLMRWLRGIQGGVQMLDFSWVEPRVLMPPTDAMSSAPDGPSSPALSPGFLEGKGLPLQPLSLWQPAERDGEGNLVAGIAGRNKQHLRQRSSAPEMSTRAAIEDYVLPPTPLAPRLAWHIAEGPVPLLLNELKGLEPPLAWPILRTLLLRNIRLEAIDVKNLLAVATSLKTLVVSSKLMDNDDIPLLNPNYETISGFSSLSKSSYEDKVSTAPLWDPSKFDGLSDLSSLSNISQPFSIDSACTEEARTSSSSLAPIDLHLFLLHNSQRRRHRLRKRNSVSKPHTQPTNTFNPDFYSLYRSYFQHNTISKSNAHSTSSTNVSRTHPTSTFNPNFYSLFQSHFHPAPNSDSSTPRIPSKVPSDSFDFTNAGSGAQSSLISGSASSRSKKGGLNMKKFGAGVVGALTAAATIKTGNAVRWGSERTLGSGHASAMPSTRGQSESGSTTRDESVEGSGVGSRKVVREPGIGALEPTTTAATADTAVSPAIEVEEPDTVDPNTDMPSGKEPLPPPKDWREELSLANITEGEEGRNVPVGHTPPRDANRNGTAKKKPKSLFFKRKDSGANTARQLEDARARESERAKSRGTRIRTEAETGQQAYELQSVATKQAVGSGLDRLREWEMEMEKQRSAARTETVKIGIGEVERVRG